MRTSCGLRHHTYLCFFCLFRPFLNGGIHPRTQRSAEALLLRPLFWSPPLKRSPTRGLRQLQPERRLAALEVYGLVYQGKPELADPLARMPRAGQHRMYFITSSAKMTCTAYGPK